MKLSKILENLEYSCDRFCDTEIKDIAYDSRKAGEGIVFVCLEGAFADGHKYAQSAYDKGSRVFVCSKDVDLPEDAVIIRTKNTRSALAKMSCSFFRNPSKEIAVIGITGTKGKTTVAHIVKFALEKAGFMCGIIGTVGAFYGDTVLPTVNTTPESYELQKMLRLMADGGCKAAAIEVSSLGLKAHRVEGTEFAYGVFTNLYPDHIGTNEHDSFEEYAYWKTQLFPMCRKAVINIDDPFSEKVIEICTCPVITYGSDKKADYCLTSMRKEKLGTRLAMGFEAVCGGKEESYRVALPGDVNAYNSLVAIAIADDMELPKENCKKGLETVFVKGRGEIVETGEDFTVIIDYAHNGVSLRSIVETAQSYEHNRIISLFGSVGGRTECRREELGTVSGEMSDLTIITSDDPDSEDPMKICEEIASYCKGEYVIIPDRAEAIHYAMKEAKSGDIIILAGKGHENYMKINGQKIPFNEREEVIKGLEMRKEG